MALQYTGTLSSSMILSDMEAHADWHGQIIRRVFFPEESGHSTVALAPPMALIDWCKKEVKAGTLDSKVVDRFLVIHQEVVVSVEALLKQAPPALAGFNSFERSFDAYIRALKRLEQDVLAVNISIDPVTGLRGVGGMWAELKRELDRRERKGEPFCLCAIEIDRLHDICMRFDRRGQEKIYTGVAKLLAASLRSFDDAYYLGKGEFLLCLKHVDLADAISVMERMRARIEQTPIPVGEGLDMLRVTVSIGISEPVPGEKVDIVVANVKEAMEQAKVEGGNRVEEFREVSPLGQYARDMRSDS